MSKYKTCTNDLTGIKHILASGHYTLIATLGSTVTDEEAHILAAAPEMYRFIKEMGAESVDRDYVLNLAEGRELLVRMHESP